MIDFLKSFHPHPPFLFLNRNTFAAIGRQLAFALLTDLPAARRREVSSAIAHYIGGVLDRESMAEIVNTLSGTANWPAAVSKPSAVRFIIQILDDGRVRWRPDTNPSELVPLPESLVRE